MCVCISLRKTRQKLIRQVKPQGLFSLVDLSNVLGAPCSIIMVSSPSLFCPSQCVPISAHSRPSFHSSRSSLYFNSWYIRILYRGYLMVLVLIYSTFSNETREGIENRKITNVSSSREVWFSSPHPLPTLVLYVLYGQHQVHTGARIILNSRERGISPLLFLHTLNCSGCCGQKLMVSCIVNFAFKILNWV